MNAAKLSTSPRLIRVLAVLEDGQEHSSLEVAARSGTIAPGTCVSELRANGYSIDCTQRHVEGKRVWYYRLIGRPSGRVA
ncbi:MAG: hypothetical protein AAFR17_12335 [Pseudomonadota bacterium]